MPGSKRSQRDTTGARRQRNEESQFSISYNPVVDLVTSRLLPTSPASRNYGRVPPEDSRHRYVTPVPHIAAGEPMLFDDSPERRVRLLDEIDVPNWTTLSGSIILLIGSMMLISVFVCLSRPDFNFVFYLFGYYLWCIESKTHPVMEVVSTDLYPRTSELRLAAKSTIKAAKHYALLLAGAVLVDLTWLYLGSSPWSCEESGSQKCWTVGGENDDLKRHVKSSYLLYQFAMFGSILNIIGKVGITTPPP